MLVEPSAVFVTVQVDPTGMSLYVCSTEAHRSRGDHEVGQAAPPQVTLMVDLALAARRRAGDVLGH